MRSGEGRCRVIEQPEDFSSSIGFKSVSCPWLYLWVCPCGGRDSSGNSGVEVRSCRVSGESSVETEHGQRSLKGSWIVSIELVRTAHGEACTKVLQRIASRAALLAVREAGVENEAGGRKMARAARKLRWKCYWEILQSKTTREGRATEF